MIKLEKACRDFVHNRYEDEDRYFSEVTVGKKRDRIWVRLMPAAAPHLRAELLQGFASYCVDTTEGR